MVTCRPLFLALMAVLGGCSVGSDLAVQRVDNTLVMAGYVDPVTLDTLDAALMANPGVHSLVLHAIPGSVDDDYFLRELSVYVRGNGLTTIVPANGVVASGGTDLAIMGKYRIIQPGACIGVHSWAVSGAFRTVSGADLSREDPDHALYLDFYRRMGIPEAFYWFTLEVAGPDDVHWMSEAEINRFGLSTVPVATGPLETADQRRQRCEARILAVQP